MTTLVSGFGPFGSNRENSSQFLVEDIQQAGLATVVTTVLPTSYERSAEQMAALVIQHSPSNILMFGLAESTTALRLEQVALNLDDCSAPDNDQDIRLRQVIVKNGPVGYRSTLPLDAMAEIAHKAGEDVVYSRDAGGYVCNHVFYAVAHLVAAAYPACRFGFVHLPALGRKSPRLSRIAGIVIDWVKLLDNC